MPTRPPRACSHPGCGAKTVVGDYCDEHRGAARRAADQERGTSKARGYGWKWRKAAKAFLREHPLCRPCQSLGVTTAATEVDHITPHKGDPVRFWDRSNWQSICHDCHVAKTIAEGGRWG